MIWSFYVGTGSAITSTVESMTAVTTIIADQTTVIGTDQITVHLTRKYFQKFSFVRDSGSL